MYYGGQVQKHYHSVGSTTTKNLLTDVVYYRCLPVQVHFSYKSVFHNMAAIMPQVSGGFLQTAQIWANARVSLIARQ